jgi:hypothetical protein
VSKYNFVNIIYNMILDNYLTYQNKVVIAIICSGFWIYFRTSDCYKMIPRGNIFPVIFVMIWTYLNYYEPLFLPIGLVILLTYSHFYKHVNPQKNTK